MNFLPLKILECNIKHRITALKFLIIVILSFFLPLNCKQDEYENTCNPSSESFKKLLQIKVLSPDSTGFCGIPGFSKNDISQTIISPLTNINYPQTIYSFTQGITVGSITPTVSGTITNCEATPTLPLGLSLEKTTCIISGTPTVGTPYVDYKITASNSAGSVFTTVRIRTLFGSAKFAYVANYSSSNISVYNIDSTTGALNLTSTTGFGSNTRDVVVDFSGKYLYAVAFSSSNIASFSINNVTGALTQIGTALATGTNPNSVTIHPTGKFLYTANASGSVSAYTIDQATGILTSGALIASGATTRWIRIDPTGKYAYTVNSGSGNMYMYSIDQTTGALSQIGLPLTIGADPRSLSITPVGNYIYTAEFNANRLTAYSLNQTTGSVVATGIFTSVSSGPESVFVHPSGKYVYITYSAVGPIGSINSYNINANTGGITLINTTTNAAIIPTRFTIDPSGKFGYSTNYNANSVTLYLIDPTTGIISTGTSYTAGTNPTNIFVTGANP